MKRELDERLQEAFPWLCRPVIERKRDYEFVSGYSIYANYGFELHDGWFTLLCDLNKEIQERYAVANISVDIRVEQIKTKWGGLRFYYSLPGSSSSIQAFDGLCGAGIRMYPKGNEDTALEELYSDIAAIVKHYEEKSKFVCEICGAAGERRTDIGWVYTLCDECYKQRKEAIEKKRNSRGI